MVGCGVAGTAALEIFSYPLDAELSVAMLLVLPLVWLVAIGLAAAGVLFLGWRCDYRSAVVLGLSAVLGFTAVVRADLHTAYPQAYFWTHRAEFTAAASFVEHVSIDQGCAGEARLPAALSGLATGRVSIGRSTDGRCAAVLWMSYASDLGYGYAYAPSARTGLVVRASPATVAVTMSLGDGWWWASTLDPGPG
jgi:hypothetical protein